MAYGGRGYVRIVDMENGKKIFDMSVEDDPLSVRFIGDSQHIIQHIIMGCKMTIQICDIATRQRISVWQVHDIVTHFSFHNNGTLMVGFEDHRIECWQKSGDKNNDHLELLWSTNIDSSTLIVEGLQAFHVIGLSDQNRRLLEQRGAFVSAKAESRAITSAQSMS